MNREVNKKMNLVGMKSLNLMSAVLVVFCLTICLNTQAAAQSSHSLAQNQTPIKNQDGRGTCWAFGGVAALEAAYNRKYDLHLDLSEQYAFHMPKAMELQPGVPDNNTSLMGFQGSSDVVKHLSRFAIPEERFAPYLNEAQMSQLRIKLKVGDIVNNPSQTGYDTFEFSEEHIPMVARWNARYRVRDYGTISDPSDLSSLEQALRDNHEIVADFNSRWKLNAQTNVYEFDSNATAEGHVMLIIGYDRDAQEFLIKNSGGEANFLRFTYDCVRNTVTGANYIKDVADPNTVQKKARYLGFWDFDHLSNNVRLKGRLVIRRFTELRNADTKSPIKLGSLYLYNGNGPLDVTGYFTNDGEGVVLDIPSPIGSISATYPLGFWRVVDRNYTGSVERGTLEQPFRSFVTAADGIQSSGMVIVLPGSYAAVRAYNKPMTIRALYGRVKLGNGN